MMLQAQRQSRDKETITPPAYMPSTFLQLMSSLPLHSMSTASAAALM